MSRPTEPPLPAGVDPQLAAALRHHEDILTGLGPSDTSAAAARAQFMASRAWWNGGGPRLAVDRDEVIPLSAERGLRVAVYAAQASQAPRPAYAFFHGGGFRLGEPRSSDRQLRELALAWGGIVVSLDYAHMPEAVFPVAVEESAAALRWLSVHGARWGIDPARLAVGGSGAGPAAPSCPGTRRAPPPPGTAAACRPGRPGGCPGAGPVAGRDRPRTPRTSRQRCGAMAASGRLRAPAWTPCRGRRRTRRPRKPPPGENRRGQGRGGRRRPWPRWPRRMNGAGRSAELVVYPGTTHLFWGYSRTVAVAQACTRDLAGFLGKHLPVAA